MSARGQIGTGAAALFIAPVVLLAGLAAHPFVRSYGHKGVIAGAVAGAPSRWAWSHVIIVLGLGLLLVAITVIRRQLRDAGEQRWSVVALPLLLVGGMLLGAAAGSEITLAAVVTSGQDVLAVLQTGESAVALYLGGAVTFATGWLCLAVALHRAPIMSPAQRWMATVALTVVAGALFVPQTSAACAYGVALVVANWLIGYHMLADKTHAAHQLPTRPTGRPESIVRIR
jgi:hypothetical protein